MLAFLIILGFIILIILLNKQKREIYELQRGVRSTFELLAKLKKQIDDGVVPKIETANDVAVETKTDLAPEPEIEVPIVSNPPVSSKIMVEAEPQDAPAEAILGDDVMHQNAVAIDQEVAPAPESAANAPIFDAQIFEPEQPKLSWFEQFKQNNPDVEKFIGENLINKIGILILVLGISFFVKYAIDKDWINEPARVGIGILCGGILVGLAHRLRSKYKAFSSVFVAGGIAVFYFTIGIAFHDYHIFNQTTAFILMVLITIFSTFVAIAYDRQELIILSTIGGFAVPFMVSTGSGNFHVLFIYLALLNVSLLVISYYKKWFWVNFIAFAFTMSIYSYWHFDTVFDIKANYPSALLYSSIFYVIFSVAFLLHSIVRKAKLVPFDITAFLLNTAIYYGLAFGVIHFYLKPYQGLFTLALALYNILFAIVLFKKYKFDYTVVYVIIGVALTFATITIPVQFSGNYISIFWAAEAVMLLWLAQKSGMKGFAVAALIVQTLALISLIMDWNLYNTDTLQQSSIFANKVFITGLVVLASFVGSFLLFKKYDFSFEKWNIGLINNQLCKQILMWTAILLAYVVPLLDINYFVPKYFRNMGTIWFFTYLYHIAFSTIFIYFSFKKEDKNIQQKIAACLVGLNILIYLLFAFRYPIVEQFTNFNLAPKQSPFAFWLHYLTLAATIFQTIFCTKYIIAQAETDSIRLQVLPWILGFVIVFVASAEINILMLGNASNTTAFYRSQTFTVKVIMPILWGILSFVFLIIGIKRNIKMLRIVALSLLGITIIKLFIYDIKNVSETGKIIAFILLGVLILVISFVYQKIKRLVIDDKENQSKNEEN